MRNVIAAIIVSSLASVATADTLSSSFASALQNDHKYLQVVHQNQAVSEDVAISHGHLLPQLSASASLLTNQTNAHTGSYTNNQWDVTLKQPLINIGLWQQLKVDKQQSHAAELSTASARLNLMTRVSQSYFKLASAKQLYTIDQQQSQAQHKLVTIAKRTFKAGKSIRTDLSAAQSAWQQTQVNLVNSQHQIDVAQSSLAVITGHSAKRIAVVTQNPRLKSPMPNSLAPWINQAQTSNLAALSDRYAMQAAMDRIKLAEAGHYPTLSASASYQNFHGNNDIIGTTNNTGTTAALSLDFPIFSGGSVVATTKKAAYAYQASNEAWLADVADARDQTRIAFQAIISDINQINTLNRSQRIQQRSVTDMVHAYEGGLRSMNDVLDEQTLLFNTKRQLINARYDYLLNQLLLKQAVGSLSISDMSHLESAFSSRETSL